MPHKFSHNTSKSKRGTSLLVPSFTENHKKNYEIINDRYPNRYHPIKFFYDDVVDVTEQPES